MDRSNPLVPLLETGPAEGPDAAARARRARALSEIARGRIANAWLRLASSIIVACVGVSIMGNLLPLYWLGIALPVLLIERAIYLRIYRRCEAGDPPEHIAGLVIWTVFQSAATASIAAILWFANFIEGETLAVMYLVAGLANAAATLRGSPPLALAGAGPVVAYLLLLPIAEFSLHGGTNSLEITPLVGALLFLGYGANLWRSLRASDAAVAQAEVAARRERQAAAAAAAAKSDTIQRMKDELRTPMAALIGSAEELRRAAVSPQARSHIAALVQAGEVLRLVFDDLSDLDKLENGELKIDAKPCDPRDLVRSVVAAFKTTAQDKNLELFVDISADVPTLVEIDALRVRQILFNLLANAIRYTTHGGVRLRLQAQAALDSRKVRLGFVVADTGAGMSRSQLAMVFKRERVNGEGPGAGLGLAICHRLAKLMGGQLGAKSEIGQGSVFSFVLEAPIAAQRSVA